MEKLITTETISGGAVYGVGQVTYTVDGVAGQDYSAALTAAAFKESTAIENAASSYAEVVRQRQKKMDDVANLLAILAKAIACKDPKSNDQDQECLKNDPELYNAVQTCRQYGISVDVSISGNTATITFGNAYKGQANIKYELDKESNNLQQDTVSLQSYLSKRDNAYSTAARLVKKANNTASTNISNIGR